MLPRGAPGKGASGQTQVGEKTRQTRSERGNGRCVSDTGHKTGPRENIVSWELVLFRSVEHHLAKSRASDTFIICLSDYFISQGVKEVADNFSRPNSNQ